MENRELEKLLSQCHKYISIQDLDGKQVSCIEFTQERFNKIIDAVSGKPLSVDTNLNILQDGLGHVFVEMSLTFSHGGIKENVLINANENIEFFQMLSENTMLAIASKESPEKIFMIQLPKPERAIHAFEIIKSGIAKGEN